MVRGLAIGGFSDWNRSRRDRRGDVLGEDTLATLDNDNDNFSIPVRNRTKNHHTAELKQGEIQS